MAARNRGIVLQFLAQNFSRHAINSTRYNFKTNIIDWRVEWVFPNVDSDPLKFVDAKCSEQKKLSQLMDKYLNPDAMPFEGSKALTYYKSAGFNGVKVLLKAEKVKGSAKKFFELDPTETLAENLSGKCIVEFPIIFVVLKDHSYNFEIISPEDEFDYDNSDKNGKDSISIAENKCEEKVSEKKDVLITNQERVAPEPVFQRKRPRQLLTQKFAEKKKQELENEIKAEIKKRPKNLLFTTGYSSEENMSDSEDNEESEDGKIVKKV